MFNKPPAQKVAEHIQELQRGLDFIDLVKDPSPLHALLADAHKSVQMTADEEAKHADDRAFMTTADTVRAALAEDRRVLTGDQELHQTDVAEFKKWRQDELDRLHEEKEENETKQRQLDDGLAKLETDRQEMQHQFDEQFKPLSQMAEDNETNRLANEKQAKALATLARKLEKQQAKIDAIRAVKDDPEEEE